MNEISAGFLKGALDIHVHTGPDLVPRQLTDSEAASAAREAGMRGLLIKSHVSETASRSSSAAKAGGCEVYGALVLNGFVGGLNPYATRAALALGAKVIFMPTFHAANHIRHHPRLYPELAMEGSTGISVLDAEGRLVPEVDAVLTAIVAHGATLATGHLAPEETAVLTRAALAAGVPRVILTHATSPLVSMTVEQMAEIARAKGVFVEHCYVDLQGLGGHPADAAIIADAIRRVGPEKTILSSDGGQGRNPLRPVEMLQRFAAVLLGQGITSEEIAIMMRQTPARALGLAI